VNKTYKNVDTTLLGFIYKTSNIRGNTIYWFVMRNLNFQILKFVT